MVEDLTNTFIHTNYVIWCLGSTNSVNLFVKVYISYTLIFSFFPLPLKTVNIMLTPRMVPGIFHQRGDSSHEGAEIWFSGYCTISAKNLQKNGFHLLMGGLTCFDGQL